MIIGAPSITPTVTPAAVIPATVNPIPDVVWSADDVPTPADTPALIAAEETPLSEPTTDENNDVSELIQSHVDSSIVPSTANLDIHVAAIKCVDTLNFTTALDLLEWVDAERELKLILTAWPTYAAESNLILRLVRRSHDGRIIEPFMRALVVISGEEKTQRSEVEPKHLYEAAVLKQSTAIIKWLIAHNFDATDAMNFLIEKVMRQKFIVSTSASAAILVDMQNYQRIAEYSDILQAICQNVKLDKLTDDAKLAIKDCHPIVFETLISHGLNVMEIVDGHEIAWWVMRNARNFISCERKSLGLTFASKLINCQNFNFHPRFFVECADMFVFDFLCQRRAFLEKLTDEVEPGKYFIHTVNDERIITQLLSSGSPPRDRSIFHPSITNKINIVRTLHANDPNIFIPFLASEEISPFAYFCLHGKYTPQHFECLKYIASNAPQTIHQVVQDNPQNRKFYLKWTALHIACNKFNLAEARNKQQNVSRREVYNSVDEIPDRDYGQQEEILFWLYDAFGTAHFQLDIYNRTPLMCLPIDTSSAGRAITRTIINKFADYDVAGLNALGHRITRLAYIDFLLTWQLAEEELMRNDHETRRMHAGARIVQSMAPWCKK